MSAAERNAVRLALATGAIVRPDLCDSCKESPSPRKDGRSTLQARLPVGVTKPLKVEWLCLRCNKKHSRTRQREPIADRFWRLTSKRGPDECWPWRGSRTRFGYGEFPTHIKGVTKAHQASWVIHNGPAGGLCVLHSCDNPWCVNPKHLWLGTKGDNNRDRSIKGRTQNAAPRIRLSKGQIAELLKARAGGASYAKCARMVNISERSAVRAIAAAIAAGAEQ